MKPVLYAAFCLLTGCLQRPHLDQQSFLLAPPPPAAPMIAQGGRVLRIRSLQVAAPFEGRSLVYRTGDFSYDRDPYAQFMVRPADGLALAVSAWFRESGAFSAVVEAGSAFKPNTLVEIQVVQLYGDFRPPENAGAVMAMRFVFFDAPNGVAGKCFFQQEYSRDIPLKTRSPAALIEGWNQALAQILNAVAQDVARFDVNAPKS